LNLFQGKTRRDYPTRTGIGTVGDFMRRMIGVGGTKPGKDRRFSASKHIISPGTSEQTQDFVLFDA